jgi:UDP-N-acetylglucosamine--dolichyl-phosphate N-acetylglucosaminephosphotransferase
MKQREGKGIFERLKRRGIPAWFYFFLPLPAAVPLMAINAGVTKMNIPLFGQMELGIIYPILIVPLAVLCCSNATNFLAGFNGLEAGMGFILLISLGSFAYVNGIYPASAIALIFGVALAGFLKYNWYPADVFPGDLTYTIGAVVACVSIIGNMEKFAIVCFTPWILEAFLKALSGFRAENFGILQSDGSVKPRDKKIRSLTHLIMRSGNFKEWHVSLILIIFEVIICLLAWSIIRFI